MRDQLKIARNKFWLHSCRRIGPSGATFNRPACFLCGLFDGNHCKYKYCNRCFLGLLGISGVKGSRRRRAVGAIVRKSRKMYALAKEPPTREQ